MKLIFWPLDRVAQDCIKLFDPMCTEGVPLLAVAQPPVPPWVVPLPGGVPAVVTLGVAPGRVQAARMILLTASMASMITRKRRCLLLITVVPLELIYLKYSLFSNTSL